MALEDTSGRGVLSHYGPRDTNELYGGTINAGGRRKSLVVVFDYDSFPGGSTDELRAYIPAGSTIIDAYLKVDTAFTGSVGVFDISVEQSDGSTSLTGLSTDSLFDGLALAEIDATVTGIKSASLHAGTNSGVACGVECVEAAYPVVAIASGTFTAGVATLTIDYLQS